MRDFGLQLYSLRDETAKDFIATLKEVAKMGYKGVEFAGYGGLKSAELRRILDDLGLETWGSHIGALPKTDAELAAEIEMNLALGNVDLICPWQDMQTREDALRYTDILNATAEKLAVQGMKLGYHNHAQELIVDVGETLIEAMLDHAPTIFMEFDVFWIAYANDDPLRLIDKYAGRQRLMHLKELGADHKSNVEIGTGILDMASIIEHGEKAGVTRFVVEQEEYTCPPIESCKIGLDALRKL